MQKGRKLETWSRSMMLPTTTKELVLTICKRPFLIHLTCRDVITCQNNAWMDSAGIAVWRDVQFAPSARAKRGKALIVWDVCGPHKVQSVRAVSEEFDVEMSELPPKMNGILQACCSQLLSKN